MLLSLLLTNIAGSRAVHHWEVEKCRHVSIIKKSTSLPNSALSKVSMTMRKEFNNIVNGHQVADGFIHRLGTPYSSVVDSHLSRSITRDTYRSLNPKKDEWCHPPLVPKWQKVQFSLSKTIEIRDQSLIETLCSVGVYSAIFASCEFKWSVCYNQCLILSPSTKWWQHDV